MRRRQPFVLLGLVWLVTGCYSSHELDARPTGPWIDVAPPPDGEPALALHGELTLVGDPDIPGGQPSLVWNGHGWGATWGRYFRVLDRDGAPLDSPARYGLFPTIDFADDRYGVSSEGGAGAGLGTYLATYAESTERIAEGTGMVGSVTDIARLTDRDQWVLAATLPGGREPIVRAQSVDDDLVPTSEPIVLGESNEARVAALGTRALAVWSDTSHRVRGQVLRGRRLEAYGSVFALAGEYPDETTRVDVEPYRDRIALAVVSQGRVWISFADLWTGGFGQRFDVSGEAMATSRAGLAVAEDGGFLVACWARFEEGAPVGTGVALQVVGRDGARWGEPLAIATDHRVAGVDCGWSGTDIVVLGWDSVDDGAHDAVWTQTVRPTFL
jgi:hypothetical protein